jgi:ABC-type amino acid transport substrate-binding protein
VQTLEKGPEDDPAVHGVQNDEPILDDVPAGHTAHEVPGTRYIPAAQEYCVGRAEGAAVVGDLEGVAVGVFVGSNVGAAVGDTEGVAVGVFVGSNVGAAVPDTEGAAVGVFVSSNVGAAVPDTEGAAVGVFVGSNVGAAVPDTEGAVVRIIIGDVVEVAFEGRVLLVEQLVESLEEYGAS